MSISPSNLLTEFLASSPWRDRLTEEQFHRVRAAATARSFAAGAIICHPEVPAGHWLGVIDGLVKVDSVSVEGRATTFAGVPSGAWFGEGAVLKGEPRPYSVVAIRKSTIAFVPRATFLWLRDNSHSFNCWLIDQLNARLGYYIALVESLRLRNTNMRVAYCIAEMFNPQLYPNTTASILISQEEIGRITGLSRQSVSRALSDLEAAGFLHLKYGSLEVLNLEGLKKLVQNGN